MMITDDSRHVEAFRSWIDGSIATVRDPIAAIQLQPASFRQINQALK